MSANATVTSNGNDSKSTNSNPTPPPTQTPPLPPHHQQWVPHQQQHQQQQWAMQYPTSAAAMMMMQQQQHQQHMMMYPQHYMPYAHHHHPYAYQQQQQQYQNKQGNFNNNNNNNNNNSTNNNNNNNNNKQQEMGSGDEAKTIWVGDLLHWMDETYLHSCFSQTGEVCSVKVIRNKQTGQSERYGFVEFYSHPTAEKVLQGYNGSLMPNTDQPFRLNWASFSAAEKRQDSGSDLSIFVGDLAPDVTDALLLDTFANKYQSVKGAKVVIDSTTGRSKGYGFVRFGDENEKAKAMTEMNGVPCSTRNMRIGAATPKKASGYPQQQYASQALVLGNGPTSNGAQDGEADNTTIFVGGLDFDVSDEDLRQPFSQFGEVLSVKIPSGKGCGFVQFANRKDAEEALDRLNGTIIGKQTVRLSWGRNQGNKQWKNHHNQWNNGGYYGRQHGYDYMMSPSHDYAATVPGAS